MVYKHFGHEIILKGIDHLIANKQIPDNLKARVTNEILEDLYKECYKGLFVTLDAIDNGIDRYPKDVKPKYDYYKTDLASRVGRLNPAWWEEPSTDAYYTNFLKAMDLCKDEFLEKLKVEVMGTIASGVIVEQAFKDNSKLDDYVIVLERPCFWKEALYKTEE